LIASTAFGMDHHCIQISEEKEQSVVLSVSTPRRISTQTIAPKYRNLTIQIPPRDLSTSQDYDNIHPKNDLLHTIHNQALIDYWRTFDKYNLPLQAHQNRLHVSSANAPQIAAAKQVPPQHHVHNQNNNARAHRQNISRTERRRIIIGAVTAYALVNGAFIWMIWN